MQKQIKLKIEINEPGISTENVHAFVLSKNTAKLNNIPFLADEYSLGDIVKFEPISKTVIQLITKHSISILLAHNSKSEKTFAKINTYLKSKGILACEGGQNGVFAVAVPITMALEAFLDIIKKSPLRLEFDDSVLRLADNGRA